MNFDRRDFFRVGAAGLAGGALEIGTLFAQERKGGGKSDTTAEFRGGTSSLALDLKLPPGTLQLQLEDFEHGRDKTLEMTGSFQSMSGTKTALYRSYFCVDDATQVFARLGDDRHWTTLVTSHTDKPQIESLTVWNDTRSPESFHIDTNKFGPGTKPEDYILEGRGGSLDLKGSRNPPSITAEDLANAVDNNPDYLAFTRGKGLTRQHATLVEFVCRFIIIAVPGGALFSLFWQGTGGS
ncbi:MAG TPA: hypothetical protein VFQ00_03245 [Terriglobales bacterium]|nr:hypothetical protein [Terriglobales bacterium]